MSITYFYWFNHFFLSGQLILLSEKEGICPGDVTTFQCTRNHSSYITFRILSSSECGSYGVTWSSYYSDTSTSSTTLRSSLLVFSLSSVTSSSITASLTVHRPELLDGATIECSSWSLQLSVVNGKVMYSQWYLRKYKKEEVELLKKTKNKKA